MRKLLMIIVLITFVGATTASAQKTLHFVEDDMNSPTGHTSGFNYGISGGGAEFLATFDSYPEDVSYIDGVSVYVSGITGSISSGSETFIWSDEFGYDWAGVSTDIADWNNYDYVLVTYVLEYTTPNGSVSEWHNVYYAYY